MSSPPTRAVMWVENARLVYGHRPEGRNVCVCEYLQQREGWPRARNMGVGTSSGSCKQRFTSTTDSERGRKCVDSEYLRLATTRAAITRVCESFDVPQVRERTIRTTAHFLHHLTFELRGKKLFSTGGAYYMVSFGHLRLVCSPCLLPCDALPYI